MKINYYERSTMDWSFMLIEYIRLNEKTGIF